MHYTVLMILNAGLGLDSMPDDRILVSRPGDQGLTQSWSRDLVTKILVLSFFKGLDNKSVVYIATSPLSLNWNNPDETGCSGSATTLSFGI